MGGYLLTISYPVTISIHAYANGLMLLLRRSVSLMKFRSGLNSVGLSGHGSCSDILASLHDIYQLLEFHLVLYMVVQYNGRQVLLWPFLIFHIHRNNSRLRLVSAWKDVIGDPIVVLGTHFLLV